MAGGFQLSVVSPGSTEAGSAAGGFARHRREPAFPETVYRIPGPAGAAAQQIRLCSRHVRRCDENTAFPYPFSARCSEARPRRSDFSPQTRPARHFGVATVSRRTAAARHASQRSVTTVLFMSCSVDFVRLPIPRPPPPPRHPVATQACPLSFAASDLV